MKDYQSIRQCTHMAPEVQSARIEFTRFDVTRYEVETHPPIVKASCVPVHVVKEWQWPSLKSREAEGDGPLWRTIRISEWRWPAKCYTCREQPDPLAPNMGWPIPPPALDGAALIVTGLIMPWEDFPRCEDETYLALDDAGWRAHSNAPINQNDGLPDDYLDFWLSETETDGEDKHA